MLVSSAKSLNNNLSQQFGRSFIYNRKRSGPKVDPCGIPQVIVF